MKIPTTCKYCNQSFPSGYAKHQHRKKVHPETFQVRSNSRPMQAASSPLDLIHEHERGIRSAIQLLDQERDQLHHRIVEIDNLVAKYKKFNEA